MHLAMIDPNLVEAVYTIASPMVGDGAFREFYHHQLGLKKKSFRLFHPLDPVPRQPSIPVPRFEIGLGYRTVGTDLRLKTTLPCFAPLDPLKEDYHSLHCYRQSLLSLPPKASPTPPARRRYWLRSM